MNPFELTVVAMKDRDAVRFAHAVNHHHQTFVPARSEISASRMRQMVIDSVGALSGKPMQITPNQGEQRLLREDFVVKLLADRIERIKFLVGGVIKSVRQLVDLVDHDASFSQTIIDRSDWEVS